MLWIDASFNFSYATRTCFYYSHHSLVHSHSSLELKTWQTSVRCNQQPPTPWLLLLWLMAEFPPSSPLRRRVVSLLFIAKCKRVESTIRFLSLLSSKTHSKSSKAPKAPLLAIQVLFIVSCWIAILCRSIDSGELNSTISQSLSLFLPGKSRGLLGFEFFFSLEVKRQRCFAIHGFFFF